MMNYLHRRFVLPAFERIKGRNTFAYLEDLERTQWLSWRQLQEMQLEPLRRLLAHAHEHCPYYGQAWSRLGLAAQQIESHDDLQRWPVIDASSIREHRDAMRARAPRLKLISKSTGGSSGVPLEFDVDAESHVRRTAAALRGYSWAGGGPGTRQLHLWGVPLNGRGLLGRIKDALYHGLHNRVVLNCFNLSEARVPLFLKRLNRFRPDVIVAYTNAIYSFARSLKERDLRPFTPKAIIVGAEKLHAFQRDLIEEVFAAPVFETYGCREFMLIASECECHEGLHVTAENLIVEILDDTGRPAYPGEEGNVVVTDLFNYGMPFIRYATGDRAVLAMAPCSCGRGLPLLKKVIGRQLDILRTPDGRMVPGEFFPHLLKDFPAIRRFQVVQEQPDEVRLRVVSSGLEQTTRETIDRLARHALGRLVRFRIEQVDDIALTAAGKLQVVINRLPPQRKAG